MAFRHTRAAAGATDGLRDAQPPAASQPRLVAEPGPAITEPRVERARVNRIEADPVRTAEMIERFRARAARLEAQRDLIRLRTRHWSGERIVEEGREEIEWWEHPEADPFAVLGLLPGAPLHDAAVARRRVAQANHPDRLGPDDDHDLARRRMVAANSAYDRLRRALHNIG